MARRAESVRKHDEAGYCWKDRDHDIRENDVSRSATGSRKMSGVSELLVQGLVLKTCQVEFHYRSIAPSTPKRFGPIESVVHALHCYFANKTIV